MLLFCRSLTALVLLCLLACPAQSQTARELREALQSRGSAQFGTTRLSTPPAPTDALEGALDPQEYHVGPGDVFSVSIGGAEPIIVSLPVTADGVLVLPSAGNVDVATLTLGEARNRVLEALRPFYRNVPLDVALAQPRRFRVHVSGAVPAPGRRTADPAARLDDVLTEALFADSLTRETWIADGFAPSLRRIQIAHRDGTSESFDVLRYRRTGDLAHNPYLQDGDQVLVSSYEIASQSVYVDGAVAFPGAFEHRPGDTVADLLVLADGPAAENDVRTVRVGDTAPVPLSQAAQVAVPAGTHVYVEEDRSVGTATVEGYVRYPGTYRIRQGETTLRELVEQAGGLLPGALVRGAYLERSYSDLRSQSFNAALNTVRAPGDLPFVTRASLSDQFSETRLSVQLDEVIGGGTGADLPLYDGDVLVVPRDEGTVLVIGAVARPGYVPVQTSGEVASYLQAAGGLRQAARDVFVVRAGTNQMRPAADVARLASGDVVLVTTDDPATRPELYGFSLQERQLTIQENNARRDARFRTISTMLTTVSTAVAVVTTYLLVRGENN